MKLCILGSTGSIGRQALDIARQDQGIRVTALAAMKNIDEIISQIREFRPLIVCMYDLASAQRLSSLLGDEKDPLLRGVRVVSGMEGLIECATFGEVDTVLVSVVGMIGILPTIEAIKAGKDICQANKEPIVCAGHIIMKLVREYGVSFTPVDSEHSAIYQCLRGEEGNRIDKIYLTCSGGPFRGRTRDELSKVTLEDALAHPNWSMGKKITVDSATLVNKGLEVIEAHYLFDVPSQDIVVLIQPGSVVHSMVQFEDGVIKAQLGTPDMKAPIAYALRGLRREPFTGERKLSPAELSEIRFYEPDLETFRGLALGIYACAHEGSINTVYNAANEECVSLFLGGRIGYLDIADTIEAVMRRHKNIPDPSLDEIFAAEREARALVREILWEAYA